MRKFLLVGAFLGLIVGPISITSSSTSADSGALFGSTAESGSAVVAAGRGFHCWVHGGAAKCIGLNDVGQLGDGTTTNRTASVTVTGLSSGVIAIAAGDAHVCALLNSGSVKCWGSNTRGQLGDGSTTNSSTPVQVTGLTSGVVRVDAGLETTCAITSVGRALCWGNNQTYGAGLVTTDTNSDGELDPVLTPSQVTGLSSGVLAVSVSGERTSSTASSTHACAVLQYGDVVCWGSNSHGQLGTTVVGNTATPQSVNTNMQMSAVSLGALHSCALSTAGGVFCWGANSYSQTGNGNTTALSFGTIVSVTGASSSITQISMGRYTSCALDISGGLLCWGDNIYGGIVQTPTRSTITAVTSPYSLSSGIRAIALGEYSTCALFVSTDLRCWGANAFGQTGDGYQIRSISPVNVHTGVANSNSLTGIQAIGASRWSNCAVTVAGGVRCWGYNYTGELGDGTVVSSPQPVLHQVFTSGVQSVDGKYFTFCATLTTGEAKCWGGNFFGMAATGDTTASSTPRSMLTAPSTPVTGVSDIEMSDFHSCVVASGAAMCSGRNTFGALGDGTITNSSYLVQVSGLTSGVSKVATGYNSFSCAVLTDGTGRCWGNDSNGQLGNGAGTTSSTPTVVSGLSGAIDIVGGDDFMCALKSDGTVACWGRNFYGQLGDGTTTTSQTPVTVTGVTGAVKIAAGPRSACAIVANGEMKCWGWNFHGIFANGTTTDSTTAVSAVGVSGMTALAMGTISSCGIFANGATKCWGSEQSGQLGNNRMENRGYAAHNILATGINPASQLAPLQVSAPTTTTTPTTTLAPSVTTTVPAGTPVVPSSTTRLDNRVYSTPPASIGGSVMVNVVSAASMRSLYLRSSTPKTCLAAGRTVVTTSPGDCVVLIRSLKSRNVLKRWKTTVVAADNGIGSTVRVASGVMFSKTSPFAYRRSLAVALNEVAGSRAALVVGHTAILTGNTQENYILSVKRARNVSMSLKNVASIQHVGVGGDVPLSTRLTESEQAQNRRVAIYYVP